MGRTHKILIGYIVGLSVLMIFCKLFLPASYPICVVVFAVITIPVWGIWRMIILNSLSIYVYEKYPNFYDKNKTITLGTQCNLISSLSLSDVRDEELKADTDLISQINYLKFMDKMTGISFVLFTAYALLSLYK